MMMSDGVIQKRVPFSSPCPAACIQFLNNCKLQDLILTKSQSYTNMVWVINPANRAATVRELANTTCIYITISLSITTCTYISIALSITTCTYNSIALSITTSICTTQKEPGIIQIHSPV